MDRRRHLAGGARHAPVGHQRHALAAVLQHAEHGVSLCSSGMPLAFGPWKRTTAMKSRELAGLEASFSACWLSNTTAGASMRRRSGFTAEVLIRPAEIAAQHLQAAVRLERLVERRQHLFVAAFFGPAHDPAAIGEARLDAIGRRPPRTTVCTSSCSRPASSSSRIRKPSAAGGVEMVHVGNAIGIDARQQRHASERSEISCQVS